MEKQKVYSERFQVHGETAWPFVKLLKKGKRPVYAKILVDGNGQHRWPKKVGTWTHKYDYVVMCFQGWHLTTLNNLLDWMLPGSKIAEYDIYLAEGRGKKDNRCTKTVFAQARLIKRITPTIDEYLSCLLSRYK